MDDLVYFYIAYTIIAAGIFGYAFWLHVQQRGLRKELDALTEVVDGGKGDY